MNVVGVMEELYIMPASLCRTPAESKRDPDLWRVGSAKIEALALHALLGRNGDDVESLRRLISVSPTEQAELAEWAACSPPAVAVGIENMLRFRSEVAREFDRLVCERALDVTQGIQNPADRV
jgi:hypothetical protein